MDAHLRDNDELLPHVFLGDVTRYVHDVLKRGDTDVVRRILVVLELAFVSPDQEARDLVAASFLENLEPNADDLRMLTALSGAAMKGVFTRWPQKSN
ncbi:MAG TPA: hypothetical protein VGV14_06345 [Rhodanobacter sp.]|nr:hypothetical protein [Rhodanobacter sp.]